MLYRPMRDADDGGLAQDLARMAELRSTQRRRMLNWLLTGSAATLAAACGGGGSGSSATTTSSTTSTTTGSGTTTTTTGSGTTTTTTGSCVLNATETNGPYPADGTNTQAGSAVNVLPLSGVLRSDIRSSFGSSTTVAQGVPLTLTFNVVNANNNCAALANYAVYIWMCDRAGLYSLYSNGVQNENYLRGVQVTNANGQVTFTSVFPGCYAGRFPHIHFEVFSSVGMATIGTNSRLISQLALPADICTTVYGSATGYSASVNNLNGVTIASDNVFRDNTAAQMAQMTAALTGSVAAGYTGTITVGVAA
jgi:protocatechuate 3,4-dioxygenase beta subunit